jgi:hypothetical protein
MSQDSSFFIREPTAGTRFGARAVGATNYQQIQLVDRHGRDAGAIADHVDAFGRIRVSQAAYVFDCQFTYSLQPLLFEQIAAGATVAHDSSNRCALFRATAATNGAYARMQTFEHFRYQAGRSHLLFLTFNFIQHVANCTKYIGYSDGSNGIEFQQLGDDTVQFVVKSTTSHGTETVTQPDWNIDKLDGTGDSGIVLDLLKTQILVIDLQALYVGRVRVGFDIDGQVVWVHQFNHANEEVYPYIATANLPIRVGMDISGGTATTSMMFICSTVISEGGNEDQGGYEFSAESASNSAGNATAAHIMSLRPSLTFQGITNRVKIAIEDVAMIITGNSAVQWQLVSGATLAGGSWAGVNTNYSTVEMNTAATATVGATAQVLATGYCAASASQKQAISSAVAVKTPITLNAAGTHRAQGTLTLMATGLTSASALRAAIAWKEIR